jgi:acetyl esterase
MAMCPMTQTFLDELAAGNLPPLYALTPDGARKTLVALQSKPVTVPDAAIEDRTLPIGPTGATRVRIVRPAGVAGRLPAVLYFHGAGWVTGDAATHDRLVREIAAGVEAAVVFVDYDRAPESRHPIAIEQCYAAVQYVAQHADALDVDAQRLAIAGDGSGGNLVAVVALLAKERVGPSILCQVLLYPVTDANFETQSYNAYADGYWLTKTTMKWFWNAYLPTEARRRDRFVAPLQATLDQLADLPPALIVTAEKDVVRDEGEAYAERLTQAGVDVSAIRVLGTIHDFAMLNALAESPGARTAITLITATLRRALAR